jgi:hypothetical protein
MAKGILYVIFNKWICDPETNVLPYKIGITEKSVDERYYGLGLKMPGKFEVLFAYRIENYKKAEQIIHDALYLYCENGEWFNVDEKRLNWVKETCENMGGIDITDEINNEIEKQIKDTQDDPSLVNDHVGQLLIKKINEYKYINIIYKNKKNTLITILTENMNKILPPNTGKKDGSWNDDTKYRYWFDINDSKTYFCLELGPKGQDEETIRIMNQITSLYNKSKVSSSVDRYRRIFNISINIGIIRNNTEEIINNEIDSLIKKLLAEEEKIISGCPHL